MSSSDRDTYLEILREEVRNLLLSQIDVCSHLVFSYECGRLFDPHAQGMYPAFVEAANRQYYQHDASRLRGTNRRSRCLPSSSGPVRCGTDYESTPTIIQSIPLHARSIRLSCQGDKLCRLAKVARAICRVDGDGRQGSPCFVSDSFGMLRGGVAPSLKAYMTDIRSRMPLYHFVIGDLPNDTKAPELDDTNAQAALAKDAAWTKQSMDRRCNIDELTIGKYLRYLVDTEFLKAPEGGASEAQALPPSALQPGQREALRSLVGRGALA